MSRAAARNRPLRVIGLMSGTSMDGVDAAYIETDGDQNLVLGAHCSTPFDPEFRTELSGFIASVPERGRSPRQSEIERALTALHAQAVDRLLTQMNIPSDRLDLIGFHGQTVWHRPSARQTWQMGNAQQLADMTGTTVVADFRSADVRAGGQGAPLVPIFHAALAKSLPRPLAILNIGGVANLTWIGRDGVHAGDFLAFDTGPGNGLIDDWILRHTGQPMDEGGMIARRGTVHEDIVVQMLTAEYFSQLPPKSLDRFAFSLGSVSALGLDDGAATLTAFTAASVGRALALCPEKPGRLLVTGGGRHNPVLMSLLERYAGVPAESVDIQGWHGDAMEAQAFGYLAVRCLHGLPITFPGTTGAASPLTGGVVVAPTSKRAAIA